MSDLTLSLDKEVLEKSIDESAKYLQTAKLEDDFENSKTQIIYGSRLVQLFFSIVIFGSGLPLFFLGQNLINPLGFVFLGLVSGFAGYHLIFTQSKLSNASHLIRNPYLDKKE